MEHLYEPDLKPGAVIDLADERFVRTEFAPGCYTPTNDKLLKAAHNRCRRRLAALTQLADIIERSDLDQAVTDNPDTL